ncbi:HAMP domain-containing sensor histidine kinase [Nocardioides sp.]|uniref:sensor histidine kinase n=1 Tax=Nocardioides sp. TaxID=35761 RepID=UPI0025FFECB6|nr:HAMP domain-containing sensor histidine kinase [Nocardioides sp.]
MGLAVGSTIAFLVVPQLVSRGWGLFNVEWLLLLTVLSGLSAFATNAALVLARAAQAQAEAREADLADALELIERGRRSGEAVFGAADVGLALLDEHGLPALINERLAEFSELAYPGGDLSAARVFDESGLTPVPIEDVPTARARRGEEFDDVRVWIGPDDATRRAMSVSARRVEDADGNVVGAAVAYTDVTDLMRAMQVKDDFVALVSHELRTPLTPIVGYIDVALDRSDLDPVLRKQLEAVARNGKRLERLVQNLIDEVQHAGRPVPVRGRDTDLAELVRGCVAGARPEACRLGLRLDAEIPDRITFRGDPRRLTQVVDNLVSNALKYTEAGGLVQVRAAATGGVVQITVRDTGIGIPPADQARLFTRFHRGTEASRRAIQGIGLGLSITKSIVESHGGRIEVESEPGRGSEFRVVLPRHAAQLAS